MKTLTTFFIAFMTFVSFGQNSNFPLVQEPSTFSKIVQVIGIDTLKLEYSKPNIKGRVFFGEIVPWGSVWRTGANASTKIELSQNMFLNGNLVPKGKYSLLTIPNKESWVIILNKNTSLWGHYGYNQDEDFLRFNVKALKSEEYLETFNIVFKKTDQYNSNIEISWGNIRVPFKIEVDRKGVDERIMASIKEKLNNPKAHKDPIVSAHIYFFSALYYQESDRDLNQALEWINKAIKIKSVNYFYYYKSEMLGAMNKYQEAIVTSKIGQDIFNSGNNTEWKLKYSEQIKKWMNKLK